MTESTYDPASFPPFAVTVDIVLFAVTDVLSVMLIERGEEPFRGDLALPGGFVQPDESVDGAAKRELAEETGLTKAKLPGVHLEQLATFGAPNRDPRMRVVSVAYVGLSRWTPTPTAGTDASAAYWVPVKRALRSSMAFDHKQILKAAIERVRSKLEYSTIATSLVDEEFSLGDLHRVYETVWGTDLDLGNFRRKVLATQGFVEQTPNRRTAEAGAPARLYRVGEGAVLVPALKRPQ